MTASEGADFRIDRGRRIVRILPTGPDDLSTLLATIPYILAHKDFKPTLGRAWDLTSMDWKPTAAEVLKLVRACRRMPRHLHAGKNALIVERGLHRQFRERMPEMVGWAEGRVHRAFPSFFEAEVWLLAPLFTPDPMGVIEISPEARAEWEAEESRFSPGAASAFLPPGSEMS